MERLIINGIDFDKKLDDAKVILNYGIHSRYQVYLYWQFYKELGIIIHEAAGIPKSPHI